MTSHPLYWCPKIFNRRTCCCPKLTNLEGVEPFSYVRTFFYFSKIFIAVGHVSEKADGEFPSLKWLLIFLTPTLSFLLTFV